MHRVRPTTRIRPRRVDPIEAALAALDPVEPQTPAPRPASARRALSLRDRLGLLKGRDEQAPLDGSEKKLIEHELAIAAELQSRLMPDRVPQKRGYDLDAFYMPAREVGGDFYDFLELDEDHLGIVIGDVAGKGIPSSLIMASTRAYLRSEAGRMLSPAETLRRVNRLLFPDLMRGMFVTVFYGVLSVSRQRFTYASAGHNPMILWRQASQSCHLVNTSGMALGFDKGPLFDRTLREQCLRLHPSDRFVLYTDGVVEAMDDKEKQLGHSRLAAACRQYAASPSGEFVGMIVSYLNRHRGSARQSDDITIVSCRVTEESIGLPGIPTRD